MGPGYKIDVGGACTMHVHDPYFIFLDHYIWAVRIVYGQTIPGKVKRTNEPKSVFWVNLFVHARDVACACGTHVPTFEPFKHYSILRVCRQSRVPSVYWLAHLLGNNARIWTMVAAVLQNKLCFLSSSSIVHDVGYVLSAWSFESLFAYSVPVLVSSMFPANKGICY